MKVILIANSEDRDKDVKAFYDAVCDEAAKTSFKFLHLELCFTGLEASYEEKKV